MQLRLRNLFINQTACADNRPIADVFDDLAGGCDPDVLANDSLLADHRLFANITVPIIRGFPVYSGFALTIVSGLLPS